MDFRPRHAPAHGGTPIQEEAWQPYSCDSIGRNERARFVASHSRLIGRHDDRVVRLLYFWKPCRILSLKFYPFRKRTPSLTSRYLADVAVGFLVRPLARFLRTNGDLRAQVRFLVTLSIMEVQRALIGLLPT